jgi:hypothetical protein
MKKFLLILIPVILIVIGIFYWFFMRTATEPMTPTPGEEQGIFDPFNRGGSTYNGSTQTNTSGSNNPSTGITSTPVGSTETKLPRLRQLSATPIGGFVASSTASSTFARYIDRGIGHVFEAISDVNEIPKISNTTIPKVYESYWNKNANMAVVRYIKDETGVITNFFAELKKVSTNASSTETNPIPYEIKGKYLATNILEVAVSPKGDRIFTFNDEETTRMGYISGFDESKKTKVFETPLRQVMINWPEENTLSVITKASGLSSGFLYHVDPRKPALKRILGDIRGLTAKTSPDAKKVIYSSGGQQLLTYILNLVDNSSQEIVFRTIAEKCVWSKLHPTEVYCAVPTEIPTGIYPDDWYKGNVTFNDQLWHLDTITGEVTLVANLLNLSQTVIDATNLTLDPKENFIYFINKKDLTFWSFDLNE